MQEINLYKKISSLKGAISIDSAKMLPQIKTRLRTEQLRVKNKKSFSFIKNKLSKRNSILHACRPYLQELNRSGKNYSFQKQTNKFIKRQKTQSDVTPKFIYSQTRAYEYVKSQQKLEKLEIMPSTSIEITSAKKAYLASRKPIIDCLVKYVQKVKQNNLDKSQIHLKNSRSLTRFNKCEQELQKLPQNKSQWSHDTIKKFNEALNDANPFFNKLNRLISLCLLKVGQIKIYNEDQFIQTEGSRMQKMGIILWGQILLKNNSNKNMKIYLFPGDSINEELVLTENDQSAAHIHYFKKGSIKTMQNAKTKMKTAILYLGLDQYNMIYTELVKIGQKSSFLKAENMIKRSFAKKKNLRKEFSYL